MRSAFSLFLILVLSTIVVVNGQWPQSQPQLNPPSTTQPQLQLQQPSLSAAGQPQLSMQQPPMQSASLQFTQPQVNNPNAAFTQYANPQQNAVPLNNQMNSVQAAVTPQSTTSPLLAFSQQFGLSPLQSANDAIRSAANNPTLMQQTASAQANAQSNNNPLSINSNSAQVMQTPRLNNALLALPQSNVAMTTAAPMSDAAAAAPLSNPLSASVPRPTLSASTIPEIIPTERAEMERVATAAGPSDQANQPSQGVSTFQVNQAAPMTSPPQMPRFTRLPPLQNTVAINQQQQVQSPSFTSSSPMFAPLPQSPGVESVAAPVIQSAAQPRSRNDELVVQYDGLTEPIGLGVSRTPHFEAEDNMIRQSYANQREYSLQLANPQLQGLRDTPYPSPQVPPPAAQTAEGQAIWQQQQQQALQDLQQVRQNPIQQLPLEAVHSNMETQQAGEESENATPADQTQTTQADNSTQQQQSATREAMQNSTQY